MSGMFDHRADGPNDLIQSIGSDDAQTVAETQSAD